MWFLHNPSVSGRYDKESGGGVVEPARAWFKISKFMSVCQFFFIGTFLNVEKILFTSSLCFQQLFQFSEIKQVFSVEVLELNSDIFIQF